MEVDKNIWTKVEFAVVEKVFSKSTKIFERNILKTFLWISLDQAASESRITKLLAYVRKKVLTAMIDGKFKRNKEELRW